MAEQENIVTSDEMSEIEAEDQKSDAKPEDDVPAEFKGMSPSDIAKQALYFRKEMGRQGNELGELRKLTDELLRSQLVKPKEEDKPREVDFFENPQEAVRRQIEANPDLQIAKQMAIEAKKEQVRSTLSRLHPDYAQVVQDANFMEWVNSSNVRKRLLKEADQFDVESADELLTTFKTLRKVKTQAVEESETKARKDVLSKASVDTSGSGESSRKVYRRADLIQLKLRDPQAYAARAEEISRAYAEGRVR